jgi:hypothetical protein
MEWIKLEVSGVPKTHIRHHSKAPLVQGAPNKPAAQPYHLELKQTPFLPETKVYLLPLLLLTQQLKQNHAMMKYSLNNRQWI